MLRECERRRGIPRAVQGRAVQSRWPRTRHQLGAMVQTLNLLLSAP